MNLLLERFCIHVFAVQLLLAEKCRRTSFVRVYFSKNKIYSLWFSRALFKPSLMLSRAVFVAEKVSRMQIHTVIFITPRQQETTRPCASTLVSFPGLPHFLFFGLENGGRPGNEATSILRSSAGLNSFPSPTTQSYVDSLARIRKYVWDYGS